MRVTKGRGSEGFSTSTARMRVRPEPQAAEQVRRPREEGPVGGALASPTALQTTNETPNFSALVRQEPSPFGAGPPR